MPALAGYWIASRTYYFKPTLAQTPAYAFPLLCAVTGVIWYVAAVSYFLALHAIIHSPPASWGTLLDAQLSLRDPLTVGALGLSALMVPYVINILMPAEEVARKWLVPDESPIDRLLREAYENRRSVEVVTHSSDAYIGRVVGPAYPWEWPEDIMIIPRVVGYRHSQSRSFVVTTVYRDRAKRPTIVLPRSSVSPSGAAIAPLISASQKPPPPDA